MHNRNAIESRFHPTADRTCALGEGGMVASAHPLATRAGIRMFKQGGNAVDVAVAAALALCVCEPQACSLGGQTHALVHMGGRSFFLDGSGRIPLHLDRSIPGADTMAYGYSATSIPTTPLVLACLLRRFGRLSWRRVILPALELAEDGYAITQLQHDLQERELTLFNAVPGRSGARYFLKQGKKPYDAGDLFVQPDLAALLKTLLDKGVMDFYTGRIAARIAQDMAGNRGFLSLEDLQTLGWPHDRPVIRQTVFGHDMVTAPPPAQGRLLIYLLKGAQIMAARGMDPVSESAMPHLADLFYSAYRIRCEQGLFADFYRPDKDHALNTGSVRDAVDRILHDNAQCRMEVPAPAGGETTHLSVMDPEGGCVGITQSVNMVYGSKAAAEGLGFLYNNYLIDSVSLPPEHPHALVPGRTPPCSVAPFILMDKEDRPWISAGSPGSQRIVTALALFLIRMLHGGMPMDQAMRMPRFHCQALREIAVEAGQYPESVIRFLTANDFKVIAHPSFYFGAVHAVLKMEGPPGFQGVAEVRRDGSTAGIY